jgi:hypothetical protein
VSKESRGVKASVLYIKYSCKHSFIWCLEENLLFCVPLPPDTTHLASRFNRTLIHDINACCCISHRFICCRFTRGQYVPTHVGGEPEARAWAGGGGTPNLHNTKICFELFRKVFHYCHRSQ